MNKRVYEEFNLIPRIYVDFNEMIDKDLVLLSKYDDKRDSADNLIHLFPGKEVHIYMDDEHFEGYKDKLIASGKVEKNNSGLFPIAKWNCRINENGIRSEMEVIEENLNSEDINIVTKTLLEVTFYNENWKWIQDLCIQFLSRENKTIKNLAIICLGHIARIHGKIEQNKVFKEFEKLEHDKEFVGTISDAMDDIKMFTK